MPYLESLYSVEVFGTPIDALSPGIVQNFSYTVEQGKVHLSWDELTQTAPAIGDTLQGISDGINKDFYASYFPIVSGTLTVYVDGVVANSEEYSVDLATGRITFNMAPTSGAVITADYVAELQDLQYYRIYRRLQGETNWSLVTERSAYTADSTPLPITTYTHVLAGDKSDDGKTWEYAISGVDDDSNEGQKTSPMTVKTIPSVPTGVRLTVGDGIIHLYWDDMKAGGKNPNLQGYNVYRTEQSGGPYTKVAESVNATEYQDTDVNNGQTYYYVVTSHDDSV